MNTHAYVSDSQVIQSVCVRSLPAPVVFVVTEDPRLSTAVKDFLHQTDGHVSIIWLTSVASACQRLSWGKAMMVILDNTPHTAATTADDLKALRSASPDTRVLVLAGDLAGRH